MSIERRKLKKLCREISYNKSLITELSSNQYNMMVLSIFAVNILSHLQQKQVKQINSSFNFRDAFEEEIKLLTKSFPFFANRLTNNLEIIPDDVFRKISNYINEIEYSFDNVLAWAYQYLKYDKEKDAYSSSLNEGKKIEGAAIAPATQFFTEDYMVKHLVNNTLKHANLTKKTLQKVKILDPACGGGNFLVYALEVLYNRFSEGESKPELIKVLVEDVLTGYDIDSNLSEVAVLNIFLKSASLIGPEQLEISPSIFTSQTHNEEIGALYKSQVEEYQLLNVSFGVSLPYSSIFIEDNFDFILTNPPFMGRRNMGKGLLKYLKDNYPTSKGDLCIAFLQRCVELVARKGVVGAVNQTSWMFLKSYSEFRKEHLEENRIIEIVDLGSNSFLDINGEKTTVALTILKKEQPQGEVKFLKLKSLTIEQKEKILFGETSLADDLIFFRSQQELIKNEGHVFHYELSNTIKDFFKNLPPYKEFATPMQGTSTGDNKQFIDYAWNRPDETDWVLVSKGGGYSKWSGLNLYKVKWGKEAEYIKQHPGSALRNLQYMENTSLVYSDTGTRGLSVRVLKAGQKFIASGPGIRIHKGEVFAHLAFLNTRTASYFLKLLNPKFTIAAGYIGQIPVTESILTSKKISDLGQKCFSLKEAYLSRKLTNTEYVQPDFKNFPSLNDYVFQTLRNDLMDELERLRLENEIEKYIQEEMNISIEDIQAMREAVGQPAFTIKNEHIEISLSKLDLLISSLLSNSCQYASNRKKTFGMEGLLEDISHSLQVNPVVLFNIIIDNLPSLHRVRKLYYEDLLHKAVLSFYGFQHNRFDYTEFNIEELASKVVTIIPFLDRFEVQDWLNNKFWTTHLKVFLNNPILEKVEFNSSLKFRSARNLITSNI